MQPFEQALQRAIDLGGGPRETSFLKRLVDAGVSCEMEDVIADAAKVEGVSRERGAELIVGEIAEAWFDSRPESILNDPEWGQPWIKRCLVLAQHAQALADHYTLKGEVSRAQLFQAEARGFRQEAADISSLTFPGMIKVERQSRGKRHARDQLLFMRLLVSHLHRWLRRPHYDVVAAVTNAVFDGVTVSGEDVRSACRRLPKAGQ
jgi:hypothetical protein